MLTALVILVALAGAALIVHLVLPAVQHQARRRRSRALRIRVSRRLFPDGTTTGRSGQPGH